MCDVPERVAREAITSTLHQLSDCVPIWCAHGLHVDDGHEELALLGLVPDAHFDVDGALGWERKVLN